MITSVWLSTRRYMTAWLNMIPFPNTLDANNENLDLGDMLLKLSIVGILQL